MLDPKKRRIPLHDDHSRPLVSIFSSRYASCFKVSCIHQVLTNKISILLWYIQHNLKCKVSLILYTALILILGLMYSRKERVDTCQRDNFKILFTLYLVISSKWGATDNNLFLSGKIRLIPWVHYKINFNSPRPTG